MFIVYKTLFNLIPNLNVSTRFDSSNLHEVREAYNITSPSSCCPDKSFKQAVHQLVPELCDLTRALLRFMASALSMRKKHLHINLLNLILFFHEYRFK